MADIIQDFPIRVPPSRVFEGVSQPALLDHWWTDRSTGVPTVGAVYELHFGPSYHWRAIVTACRPAELFELRITEADRDWTGTVMGFELEPSEAGTQVRFYHRGWPEPNPHYRTSCHCWALYLRLLRRHLEHGETVPYEKRLEA
jgi:uncharacterized protein YndB with AHSA1/START domain